MKSDGIVVVPFVYMADFAKKAMVVQLVDVMVIMDHCVK